MQRRTMALAVVLLGALVAVLALSACGGGSSSSSSASGGAPVKGGTLIATYQGEPQGLDPAIDWEGQGWAIEHCLFNNFIKYASAPGKAGTQMLPDLATEIPTPANGGVTDGGKTYTFHLKKGIKFAPPVDREVTSADFKYSFERMMGSPRAPATSFYMGVVGADQFVAHKATEISGFKVVNDYTVQITLKSPDLSFLNAITMDFCDAVPKAIAVASPAHTRRR